MRDPYHLPLSALPAVGGILGTEWTAGPVPPPAPQQQHGVPIMFAPRAFTPGNAGPVTSTMEARHLFAQSCLPSLN
uniref:Uncharacterized protein n=1 Tax=Globodera pallida TaxID=36090 RepID=A0A183BY86_GLOPA